MNHAKADLGILLKHALSDLANNPIVGAFLTAIALVTAFTVGMLFSIGPSFLPLVDKADLLAVLLFYSSVLGIGLRMVTIYINNVVVDFLDRFLKREPIGPRQPFLVRHKVLSGVVFFALLMVATVGGCAAIVMAAAGVENWERWAIIPALAFAATSGMLISRRSQGAIQMLQLEFLMLALLSGAAWVGILRDAAPKVSLSLVGFEELQPATIILAANNGIIVFFAGERSVRYVSWGTIDQILYAPLFESSDHPLTPTTPSPSPAPPA